MHVREFISARGVWVAPVAIVVVIIAVCVLLRSTFHEARPGPITQAYYSDDDGATYFADDLLKAYPFDHNGKTAYRAYVYRCGDSGNAFVGYLARQIGDGRSPAFTSTADAVKAAVHGGKNNTSVEVKKPGNNAWFSLDTPGGQAIANVVCADGQRPLAALPGE